MKFTKPPISITDQIDLLARRGMAIPDPARAAHFLRHISYYRLRAYWLPFEEAAAINGDHQFRSGVSFEDVLSLYVFDRRLRLLGMDAIERIEVSLRGDWAHHIAMKYGSHGYLDPAIYGRTDHFEKALANLKEEIDRSRDTFIVHYADKYNDPKLPPIWMTAEVISLGQLSKWLGNLKHRADRQAIAKPYGLDEKILVSAAHHLTYVRNICAHHGRLWNKQFTVTMVVPNSPASLKLAMNANTPRKLYNTLVIIGYLMGVIAPGSDWRRHLIELLADCQSEAIAAMGFPPDWKARPFWALESV